jgi:hypothetical protein
VAHPSFIFFLLAHISNPGIHNAEVELLVSGQTGLHSESLRRKPKPKQQQMGKLQEYSSEAGGEDDRAGPG